MTAAQGLTGALIGTVKDAEGGVLPGAVVRVSAPALIGGPATLTTNQKGQLRFLALPPGSYVLDIELQGFTSYHEEDIRIGVSATIERTAVLNTGVSAFGSDCRFVYNSGFPLQAISSGLSNAGGLVVRPPRSRATPSR